MHWVTFQPVSKEEDIFTKMPGSQHHPTEFSIFQNAVWTHLPVNKTVYDSSYLEELEWEKQWTVPV